MKDDKAKIYFKFNKLEIEYEGDPSFLKEDIFNLMEQITSLYVKNSVVLPVGPSLNESENIVTLSENPVPDLSIETIASHLDAKQGPELVMAAAMYLTFFRKMSKFSRQDILNTMKEASNYYKESMGGNLTASLSRLVKKKRLNSLSVGNYALSATEKNKMEAEFAKIV